MASNSCGAQPCDTSLAMYANISQWELVSKIPKASRVRPPVPAPISATRNPVQHGPSALGNNTSLWPHLPFSRQPGHPHTFKPNFHNIAEAMVEHVPDPTICHLPAGKLSITQSSIISSVSRPMWCDAAKSLLYNSRNSGCCGQSRLFFKIKEIFVETMLQCLVYCPSIASTQYSLQYMSAIAYIDLITADNR